MDREKYAKIAIWHIITRSIIANVISCAKYVQLLRSKNGGFSAKLRRIYHEKIFVGRA